jgi:hypothetical protein
MTKWDKYMLTNSTYCQGCIIRLLHANLCKHAYPLQPLLCTNVCHMCSDGTYPIGIGATAVTWAAVAMDNAALNLEWDASSGVSL